MFADSSKVTAITVDRIAAESARIGVRNPRSHVMALSSGQELIIPSEEAALKTAEMAFNAEALPDFVLEDGMRIEWAAMLRLLDKIAPDYRD